jgi:hypothetical protein
MGEQGLGLDLSGVDLPGMPSGTNKTDLQIWVATRRNMTAQSDVFNVFLRISNAFSIVDLLQ